MTNTKETKPYKQYKTYFVYLLECLDKTYYCGYTTDLKKRVETHNLGKTGAKYTKPRRPVKLIYSEAFTNLSDALKREHQIKRLSREEKTSLVESSIIPVCS